MFDYYNSNDEATKLIPLARALRLRREREAGVEKPAPRAVTNEIRIVPASIVQYEARINAIIPEAESFADEVLSGAAPGDAASLEYQESFGYRWNMVFHAAMDDMAFKQGLRQQSYQVK